MAPPGLGGRSGKVGVKIDKAGAGYVAPVVGLTTGAAVQIPPHVGDHDGVSVVGEPFGVDQRSVPVHLYLPGARSAAARTSHTISATSAAWVRISRWRPSAMVRRRTSGNLRSM